MSIVQHKAQPHKVKDNPFGQTLTDNLEGTLVLTAMLSQGLQIISKNIGVNDYAVKMITDN